MAFKDNKELSAFYDGLLGKSDLRFPIADYPEFAKLLALKPDSLILDVACGKGFMLGAFNSALKPIGIDFSQSALQASRDRGLNRLAKGEAENLPFASETFDFLYNLGSLEHFLDKGKSISEMARVVKKDGKALIIVPNSTDLKTAWKKFRTGEGNDQDGQEELALMSHAEWRTLLEASGLSVERTVKYNGFAAIDWFCKRSDPSVITATEKNLRTLLNIFLKPFIPLQYSAYFIFICRPSGE